jgi:predicted nucleic acid-binding protein
MTPVLIDTNVLIYACDTADYLRQERAIQVIKYLEVTGTGRLSVQCLAEFVNATTRSRRPLYSRSEARVQVERLARAYIIFDLTPMIILEAARGMCDHSLAYYDAQIWATARLNQIPLVFSEDFQDRQILEGVRFVNPFSAQFELRDWN